MKHHDFLKELIQNDPRLQSEFIKYCFQKLNDDESFLEIFFKDYIVNLELSLSKLFKLLQNIDESILAELMLYKDFPSMRFFSESVPEKLEGKIKFTLIDGFAILKNYGLSKTLGINEKHKIYILKIKAEKQSMNLNEKDLKGLLGATGLFKKNTKKSGYKPNSVWTVKKK